LGTRFHLDDLRTGYVALAQGVGLVVASVSVGPLLDHRGKKVGLLLGLGLVAASLYGLANAGGFTAMISMMFAMGLGGGITLTAANAMGTDVNEARRASVLNILNVFVGLGGFATPFIAGNLLGGDAARVAYAAAILTTITFLIDAAIKIPERVEAGGQKGASSAVFRRPVLYLLALTTFLYTACEFGIWNWLVKYLITRGIPESSALNILSFGFALGLLLGRVIIAPILIKVSPFAVTFAAAIVMAVTTFSILHAEGTAACGLLVFCAGFAMAPVFPTTIAIVAGFFQKGTSTAIGFTITCGFSGLVVSSPIIGFLSGSNPNGLGTGLLVLPACSLLIAAIQLGVRRVPVEHASLNQPQRI
jgi:fucose permease